MNFLASPVAKKFLEEGKLPTFEVLFVLEQGTLYDLIAGLAFVSVLIVLLVQTFKLFA